MLAGCPICRKVYRIDEAKISPGGINLRCTECATLFRIAGRTASATNHLDAGEHGGVGRLPRILVGQGDAAEGESIAGAIASIHLEVTSFADGERLLAAAFAEPPDLVVLDVAIPGLFSFQVCEALKNNSDTASIPIILITSQYDGARFIRKPQSLYGADDCLDADRVKDELLGKILGIIDSRTMNG